MSIYTENGYHNRADYLECLADDFGVDLDSVLCIAEMLGQDEDFDGLVSMVDDYSHRLFNADLRG